VGPPQRRPSGGAPSPLNLQGKTPLKTASRCLHFNDHSVAAVRACDKSNYNHANVNMLRFIPRKPRYDACYSLDVTPVQTIIEVERNQATGKLLGFYEVRWCAAKYGLNLFLMLTYGL
jgi:hypothetical protein